MADVILKQFYVGLISSEHHVFFHSENLFILLITTKTKHNKTKQNNEQKHNIHSSHGYNVHENKSIIIIHSSFWIIRFYQISSGYNKYQCLLCRCLQL